MFGNRPVYMFFFQNGRSLFQINNTNKRSGKNRKKILRDLYEDDMKNQLALIKHTSDQICLLTSKLRTFILVILSHE